MKVAELQRSLFLCGFMGVGKTTVGRLLAENLACAFFDTDALVTAEAGLSIPEIFAGEGEAGFRRREQNALLSVLSKGAVVSLGGGALNAEENLKAVLASGTLIYLSAKPESLLARLRDTVDSRPLLAGLSEQARRVKIDQMLAERLSVYQRASIEIATDEKEAMVVVAEILARIAEKAS